MTRTRLAAIAFLALAGLAVAFLTLRPGADREVASDDPSAPERRVTTSAAPVAVRTVQARLAEGTSDTRGITATGTLRADREADLAFAVDGVVARIPVEQGDAVTRGQVMARLDPVPIEAARDQAEARVRFLRLRLDRTENLYVNEAVSKEQVDADRAELQAAEAQLEMASWRVEQSVLRAPFSGKVLSSRIEPGEVVGSGMVVFTLLAVDTLEVEVGIPAKDLGAARARAAVQVRVPDLNGLTVPGVVDHVPVSSDPRAGSVAVLVRVPNPDGSLLPGLLVECTFGEAPASPAEPEVRVPVTALRITPGGPAVLRVEGGRAIEVSVEIGAVRGDEVVVLSGLRAGDVLVAEAPDRLRPGDPVQDTRPAADTASVQSAS
jgi:membrane fusion protein (multidrug efflux system)